MITGKSTHNQRIERLWRDVYDGVLAFYYSLFYFMEDQGILNTSELSHLSALHYIFLPKINHKLEIWRNAWNRHRIRTVKASPLQLWISGQYQNPEGIEIDHQELEFYGVEENVLEYDESLDERPVFTTPSIITDTCFDELNTKITEEDKTDNHGITSFLLAVRIIKESSN